MKQAEKIQKAKCIVCNLIGIEKTDITRASPEMRRDSIGSRKKGWEKILDILQLNRIILLDTPHSVGDTLIIPEEIK